MSIKNTTENNSWEENKNCDGNVNCKCTNHRVYSHAYKETQNDDIQNKNNECWYALSKELNNAKCEVSKNKADYKEFTTKNIQDAWNHKNKSIMNKSYLFDAKDRPA